MAGACPGDVGARPAAGGRHGARARARPHARPGRQRGRDRRGRADGVSRDRHPAGARRTPAFPAMSGTPGELSLFVSRVQDLVGRAPVTCAPSATAVEIARLLSRERVGSAVVLDGEGRPAGIVTDRDLRGKVVEAALDPSTTRAAAIMSSPVVTVRPNAFAFEALLERARRDFHNLAVAEGGRRLGVLSSNDFIRLQTTHPVLLGREIAAAASLEALAQLASRTTPLVRRLLD